MRPFPLLLCLSLTMFTASAIPLQERQDGDGDPLSALNSFISSALDPDPTPPSAPSAPSAPQPAAPTAPAPPTETTTKHHKSASTGSITIGDALTASETSSATSTSTSISTTSTSSSSSISSSSTSTILSTATVVPVAPPPTSTPQPTKDSGNSVSPAGIAVAVIMSLAVLGAVFFLVWKFYGPVRRWREKREYEKMQERTYRPALDGPMAGKGGEKGLGLSYIDQERPLSFLEAVKPKRHGIKRKTIGSGPRGFAGTGKSPLVSETASTTSLPMEKGLPAIPQHIR